MRLSKAIELLGNNVVQVNNLNGSDLEFTRVETDSRLLEPGDLFICIQGNSFDSHLIARELEVKGAVALIVQNPLDEFELGVPVIHVKDSRLSEAILTMEQFGNPYRELSTIAVTGTNGKTTVTTLIHHVLNAFERKTSLVGTVKNVIGDKIFVNPKNTTPGPIALAKYLRLSVEESCKYFVMEVSSHAISMNRVQGARFDIAVITNVTRDHLDFHESFDDYYRTKLRMFNLLKSTGLAVINSDKINIADVHVKREKIVTYGFGNESDYRIENLDLAKTGMEFTIHTPFGSAHRVYTRLIGEHNAYNVAAAIAVLNSMNFDIEHIVEAVSNFGGVPGRVEFGE